MKSQTNVSSVARQRRHDLLAVLLATAFASTALPLVAQQAPTPSSIPASEAADNPIELSPFNVNESHNIGYGAATTASTSRMVQNYVDVPQTVNVITSDFINDFNIQDVRSLTEYIPNIEWGLTNNNSSMRLRGAAVTSTYIDGVVTVSSGAEMPLQFFDRVELVKGPSSAAFGLGQPGGLINYVSKTPQGVDKREYTVGFGDNSNYLANFDVQGVSKQDSRLKYRAVGFWEQGGYENYGWKHSGTGAEFSLKYDLNKTTFFDAIVAYSDTVYPDRSGVENIWKDPTIYEVWQIASRNDVHSYLPGTVFADGSVFDVSGTNPPLASPGHQAAIGIFGTGKFTSVGNDPLPVDWQGDERRNLRATLIASKDLADGHIHLRADLANEWATFETHDSAPDSFDSNYDKPLIPVGFYGVGVARSLSRGHPESHELGLDAIGNFNLFGGAWQTLAGGNFYERRASTFSYLIDNVNADGSVAYANLYTQNQHMYVPNTYTVTTDNSSKTEGYGVYAQEDVTFFNGILNVLGGWRIDYFKTDTNNNIDYSVNHSGNLNTGIKPRYAVTVKPMKWLSLYAMHTVSRDPQRSTNKYFVANGSYLSLSAADQAKYPLSELEFYSPGGTTDEAGSKVSFFGGNLYASVAFFKSKTQGQLNPIVAVNVTNNDGSNTQIGVQQVQGTDVHGTEVEIFGQATKRLSFTANYGIVRGNYPDFANGTPDRIDPSASISLHGKLDLGDLRGSGAYLTFGGLWHGPYYAYQDATATYFDHRNQYQYDGGIGYAWKHGGHNHRVYLSCTNVDNTLMTIGTVTPWTALPLRKTTLTYTAEF